MTKHNHETTNMIAADHIRHLTRGWTTTNTITQPHQTPNGTWTTQQHQHTTTHPPLLDQLQHAATSSTYTSDDPYRGHPGSKPAARLDAIDTLHRINTQSITLAHQLGATQPQPLRKRLTTIAGKLGNQPNPTVRSWWIAARVTTGWETRPYNPPVHCPVETCEQRGTLHIRLEDRIGYCTNCKTTWEPELIGQLAAWVKWAAEHLNGPHHWTTNSDGHTTECSECAGVRREMTARQNKRTKPKPTKVA